MSKAAHGRGYQFDKARYYVSPTAKPGFMVIDTFKAANGQEQDYIYLSAFEGSLYDTSENAYIMDDAQVADFEKDTGDKLCSIAGAKPASGKTQNLTRSNTRALVIIVMQMLRQTTQPEGWVGDSMIFCSFYYSDPYVSRVCSL